MDCVVVYESMFGNTRALAEAIAEGVGEAVVVAVHEAESEPQPADLLIVGGPTHVHGMATVRTRRMAAQSAAEHGHPLEPGAADGPNLRGWLDELPKVQSRFAAAFDTRLDHSPLMTGMAARAIARRLRRRGYALTATESFLVSEAEGPLRKGELERARAWGAEVASRVSEELASDVRR
jgi:hypothetical protein